MNIKSIMLAMTAIALSSNVAAVIIDNNTYTTDTTSGLDWLDLSATRFRSYDDISSQLVIGGEFEGWRYATNTESIEFLNVFGGDSDFYNGWSTQKQWFV